MPTYQYLCDSCGYEFEEFQSMSDDPISECPKCKGKPRRLISGGAGFLLKGNGFYQTDYRSSKYKAEAQKDMSNGLTSSSSDSSKKTDKPKSTGDKS